MSNRLTVGRIALIPVMIGAFFLPFSWGHQAAALLFLLAAITDWLDGWLARRRNETTPFGRFLDPVADKLVVASALILLVGRNWAPALAAIVIVGREIAISALREWLAGRRTTLAVSALGKLKTAAQMTAITLLLWHAPIQGWPTATIGEALLWLAAVLTLVSGWAYLRAAQQDLGADGPPLDASPSTTTTGRNPPP